MKVYSESEIRELKKLDQRIIYTLHLIFRSFKKGP